MIEIAPDVEVTFEEFARACDLVDGYFDETLDEVAVRSPVSRRQLVAVLARAQLSGRQRALEGALHRSETVYRSREETVLWIEGGFWIDVGRQHGLDADERRAARAVHGLVIDVIDDGNARAARDRDPFVLVERFDPYES